MRSDLETEAFDVGGRRLVGGLRGLLAAAGADSDGAVIEALGELGQVVAAGQPVVRLVKGWRPSGPDQPAGNRPPADGPTAVATLFGQADGSQHARLAMRC